MIIVKNTGSDTLKWLGAIIKDNSKANSWVYVISPRFDTTEFYKKYSNLTFYSFGRLFYLFAFLKVLFKKKKPDIVYGDNKLFLRFLNLCSIKNTLEIKL